MDIDVVNGVAAKRKGADIRSEIAASARALVVFLEGNAKAHTLRYAFHSSFPANCCESASIIFKYLLEEKYGLSDVRVIRGIRPTTDERHFWVVARGLSYDLTASQFGLADPLIGVPDHPLFKTFPDQDGAVRWELIDRTRVVSLFRTEKIAF